jgi:hypothetical protein
VHSFDGVRLAVARLVLEDDVRFAQRVRPARRRRSSKMQDTSTAHA